MTSLLLATLALAEEGAAPPPRSVATGEVRVETVQEGAEVYLLTRDQSDYDYGEIEVLQCRTPCTFSLPSGYARLRLKYPQHLSTTVRVSPQAGRPVRVTGSLASIPAIATGAVVGGVGLGVTVLGPFVGLIVVIGEASRGANFGGDDILLAVLGPMAAGGLLAVGGGVLLITAIPDLTVTQAPPDSYAAVRVTPWFSGNAVGLTGRF